jgi:Flp pilus assembly protein TadG
MRSTELSTRIKSPQRKLQEGQAIVLIALLILVLFGMLGLAIDSGRSYVDRRDQQAAVDAAALAMGDWYDNYPDATDLVNLTYPASLKVYTNNLHLYGAATSHSAATANVGVGNNLPQNTWVDSFNGGYTLTIVATNTQFNGYQFIFTSTHQFPLAFMQIFGGPADVTINATASSIVGNQRQTPALLTLSSGACATSLQGNGSLTVLGDVYTNGTACINSSLHLSGNCYGAAGSNCSAASYYCYNPSPGFIPYPAPCQQGDLLGAPNVPAPSLPDPGYTAPSQPFYAGIGFQLDRGSYTEMTPGVYNNFALNGGDGCYFLDAGVYTWNGGYSSHGGLVSNELKAPDEEQWGPLGIPGIGPGTTNGATTQFWSAAGCAGSFNLSVVPAAGNGMKHQGGAGNWGIELTSDRYDRFIDPNIGPNPCFNSPGCRRESTPSKCQQVNTSDASNSGIDINITKNSPGAQYYLVYINPNGCDGVPNNFSFAGRYKAPGFTDAGGPPATAIGPPWTGTLANGVNGWPCAVAGVSICNITYNSLLPNSLCFAQSRTQLCQPPDDEIQPQCFASCPPSASVPQENAGMALQYPPNTGGDVANENYCVISPVPGDANAPCTTAKVTPGAVQFYFPNGACLDQNGGGYTHAFSGEQYNWIVIYQPLGSTCPAPAGNLLNGNALTQYIGTIYTPSSSWNIQGTDKSPLAGQVICYTATVIGNGNAGIDFNPNYSPAPPAARLIN